MNKEITAPRTLLPYYFSWKINNLNTNYNVCFSYVLDKIINKNKLWNSIKILVHNRPHLRANFKFKNNQINYVVHKELSPIFHKISVYSENEYNQKIEYLIKDPHNLHEGSLLKVTFINRKYINDTVVLFNIHHSIIDGSSLDSFISDLSKIYNNIQTQVESDENHLNSFLILPKIEPNMEDQKLKNYINTLKNIAYESEKYSIKENNTIISSYQIMDNNLYNKIKKFSEKNSISIFNILLISWCIFEAKLFNKDKLTVTYPINIKKNKTDNGCIINLIYYPFIYDNKQNMILTIEMFKVQLSFLKKIHYINLIDFINSNEFTYSHFAYSGFAKLKPIEIENQKIDAITYPQMANSSFGIKYIKENNKLHFLAEFYSGTIPEYLSKDLTNRFLNFLKKLIQNSESEFSSLNILYEKEYNHIVYKLNKTEKEFTKNKSISQVFESIVCKHQNKTAAIDKFKSLTYLELNQKSNQLARFLLEKNIKINDTVAILIDNRVEMLIAILAVLKIGAIYLPISHDTPKERIEFIINDSNAKKILTISNLYQNTELPIEIIDLTDNNNYKGDFFNINIKTSEKNIAYLMYTSGSTARPKGVLVENKSILNLIEFQINQFHISPQDNLSKFSAFSFDASIFETFSSLLSGATLYFIPEEFRIDINKLNNFFNEKNITFAFLPTKFAEIFIQLENFSLKKLFVGGEKLKFYKDTPYQLINNYGPTESTVISTFFYVDKYYDNIPIGKPIQNSKIYILNKDHNPCPYLMKGEIFIGGEILAREYLNQKELTQEKFIPNPFQTPEEKSLGINERIYKSGDLGRLLHDGNIEILGRTDFQLKIRGFRIEISEIENQILCIPGIKNTVVIGFEDKSEHKYLCAYYVSDTKLDIEIIKEYLNRNLPNYMIPKLFIHIKNLPININGKIDKKLLPEPNFKDLQTGLYIPPRNKKEKIISKVFSEVLEIEDIGIYDDFFILGGNSIKAIRLTTKLQMYFNMDISHIFIQRNIKNLAENFKFNYKINHRS